MSDDAKTIRKSYTENLSKSLLIWLTPRNLTILLIFLTPFSLGNFGFNYIYVTWVVVTLFVLTSFNDIASHRRILKSNFFIPGLLFVLSFFASVQFGLEYKELYEFTVYKSSKSSVILDILVFLPMQVLVVYSIYVTTKKVEDLMLFIKSIIISGILVNLISFGYLLSAKLIEGRLGGTFEDTNYFGRFEVLMVAVSLSFILFYKKDIKLKLFFITFLIVCANFLRLSSSRAAIIALGVMVLTSSVFIKSRKVKYSLIILSVITVVSFLAYAALIKGGIGGGAFSSFIDLSNATRLALNIGAFNMFLDYPFFGVGFRNFYNIYINHGYIPLDIPVVYSISVVHSWLFSILAEQGLMGTGSLLYILFLIFKNLNKKIKNAVNEDMKVIGVSLFSMNVVFYFFGLFSPSFLPELLFSLLLGLTGAYFKVYEIEESKSSDVLLQNKNKFLHANVFNK